MFHEAMKPSNFVESSNATSLSCTCKINLCKSFFMLFVIARVIRPSFSAKDLVNIWSHQLDQLGPHPDLYYFVFSLIYIFYFILLLNDSLNFLNFK